MTDSNKQRERNNLPIGVFDSGLGGLTVVAALQQKLPEESIIYLGDNARVPYGTKSSETIKQYAWNCSRFLIKKGLKMLVVACNTASAIAIDSLKEGLDIPVLGVIHAGARSATDDHTVNRIGVIGTLGTVGSGAYPEQINKIVPHVDIFQNPAPLLVPLVEEGWVDGDVPGLAVERYIAPLVKKNIDVLLLGCTHYPVLSLLIDSKLKQMGSSAVIVDSAHAMADEVKRSLVDLGIAAQSGLKGTFTCYVTDIPASFADVAERFLGHDTGIVEKVDI